VGYIYIYILYKGKETRNKGTNSNKQVGPTYRRKEEKLGEIFIEDKMRKNCQ
jgi:hypothetical protein